MPLEMAKCNACATSGGGRIGALSYGAHPRDIGRRASISADALAMAFVPDLPSGDRHRRAPLRIGGISTADARCTRESELNNLEVLRRCCIAQAAQNHRFLHDCQLFAEMRRRQLRRYRGHSISLAAGKIDNRETFVAA